MIFTVGVHFGDPNRHGVWPSMVSLFFDHMGCRPRNEIGPATGDTAYPLICIQSPPWPRAQPLSPFPALKALDISATATDWAWVFERMVVGEMHWGLSNVRLPQGVRNVFGLPGVSRVLFDSLALKCVLFHVSAVVKPQVLSVPSHV